MTVRLIGLVATFLDLLAGHFGQLPENVGHLLGHGGLASFRSTATSSLNQFNAVKIFPNPVSADFTGMVAISGLYTDAIVKITDIGGRLIWQTRANGGTAVWNARQSNGDRVNSGIYLVFATSEDGSERHVGKIAIVE